MIQVLPNLVVPDSRSEKETKTQKALKKMREVSQEEATSKLAKKCNLPYADLHIVPINFEDVTLIPEEMARRHSIGIFLKRGKKVRIAVTDPYSTPALQYIETLQDEHGWDTKLFVVSESSMQKLFERYHATTLLKSIDDLRMTLSQGNLQNFEKEFGALLRLKNRMNELPTTEIISLVLSGAIKLKASDIHFEPESAGVRLRYRIDGVLQDIGTLSEKTYRFVLSRVKIMSKMKINIRKIAQDGHFSVDIEGKAVEEGKDPEKGKLDIRASVIPSRFGESIVMRLLKQESVFVDVEELGLQGAALEHVQQEMMKPNGMIVTTGPTGSGKTTTLYSIINKLNKPDTKIITIEDPIEYEIQGVSQTEVAKNEGYTFDKGLRAIVRQDPDIILVGEIRDDETADIALNASLTGHLVLSTLHTNDAAGSIPRFIELGVKPSLIPAAVNVMIAQRLVRKLCTSCKEEYEPAEDTLETLRQMLSVISPKARVDIPKKITTLYRPVGCKKCNNLGYRGRIGVFEVLDLNDELKELVENMASAREITHAAIENGMITMAQDGILKAIKGETSLEEVWRVSGQVDFLQDMYEKLMEQSLGRALLLSEKTLRDIITIANTKESFQNYLKQVDVQGLAEAVFAAAVYYRAGDIHLEPEEESVNIRFRIDGMLQSMGRIPLTEYPSLLGKIKMMSGLKTEIKGGVVDSRFSLKLEKTFEPYTEEKIDVRVSIILGGYGETAVLRMLDKSAVALDIDKLDIRQENLQKILHEIGKPNGIFLNTGPTGSGKTTTLYTLLQKLNTPEIKIMTVEDPIEYQLPGILQTQTNEKEGYTFANALEALLRQNPDIIMIGEIRENDTAVIATQASLTGHLVLSTLHTNDAAGSIQRLLNMGVRGEDLATAVNAFMAQRLVRRLCICKVGYTPTEEERVLIQSVLDSLSEKSHVQKPTIEIIYEPKGCEKCQGIGYKGRTTVTEVLVIDREIESLIARMTLASEIHDVAVKNGMITMAQDGILKVLEGTTTLEEVKRVTEL